jgi:Arm DNA-binding domain
MIYGTEKLDMTRKINKLTARSVATITKPGRHSDGRTLYLSISKNDGGRRWVFMFSLHGRITELGLGSARDVPLARARELAEQARSKLAESRLRDRLERVLDGAPTSAAAG